MNTIWYIFSSMLQYEKALLPSADEGQRTFSSKVRLEGYRTIILDERGEGARVCMHLNTV